MVYANTYTVRRENVTRESKILIGVLVLIAGAMIGLFALANGGEEPKATGDKKSIIRPDSHKLGAGPVQLVEYGDYQCPACGNAHPIVKQILKDFDGKVTFYFRNFPLAQVHPNAMAAANAAESAAAQGKFWEMHDMLFQSQREWSELAGTTAINKFAEYAKSIGLDSAKVKQAATNKEFQARIDQDIADGNAQGVQSTPTFLVNGKPVRTSSYAALRDAIEAELKTASPAASASPGATTSPAPTTPAASPAPAQ